MGDVAGRAVTSRFAAAAAIVAAIATPAPSRPVGSCGIDLQQTSADGRLLNHFPYPVERRQDLVRPPAALPGQCQAINADMKRDLEALLAAARTAPGVGSSIVALSCYRDMQHQARLFCRNGREALIAQAYQVAPPGFSEHSTGFAIDFGSRRAGGCNLVACFAGTAVGKWLLKNAPDFGFELSFPKGNAQGVAFEPWHWRWVGRSADDSSLRARSIFAAAREQFPAVIKDVPPASLGIAARPISRLAPATAQP